MGRNQNWQFGLFAALFFTKSNFRDTHPDIEMVFLTGDFPAHDVWRQDKKHNKASSKAIVDSVTR
jgi:hypothetical protein